MKNLVIICSIALLSISCKQTANEAGVVDDSKQATIDSMNVVMDKQKAEIAKQKTIDSMQAVADNKKERTVVVHQAAATQAASAPEAKKKGWSGAAKGAAIGAGVGAVTGAIVNKHNSGAGAVIGGLAGAGVGAGTGAIIDSQKKKKEEEKNQNK